MDSITLFSDILTMIALPITVIVLLVYLTLTLVKVIETLKKVDILTTDLKHKMDLLEGPIQTVNHLNEMISKFSEIIKPLLLVGSTLKAKKKLHK